MVWNGPCHPHICLRRNERMTLRKVSFCPPFTLILGVGLIVNVCTASLIVGADKKIVDGLAEQLQRGGGAVDRRNNVTVKVVVVA